MVNFPSNLKLFLCGSAVVCVSLAPAAMAQTPEANEAAYRSLLQQIDNKKLNIAHKQAIIGHQGMKIDNLNEQLGRVDELNASVEPMIAKMVSNIEREIRSDYPFEYDARMFRLNSLKETMDNPAASVSAKYRKALNIYQAEVNYGQSVVAKDGDHPIKPTIREGDDRYKKDEEGKVEFNEKTGLPVPVFDGTYLRYGRMAYVYINSDGTDAMRWDLKGGADKQGAWVPMKGSTVEIRMAMRVAKGELAPSVVMAPVMPVN